MNDAVRSELQRYRTDYEDVWAPRCFWILDKYERYRRLVLRPCQRAVGAAERVMLSTYGMARLLILKGRQGGFTTDQQARALHTIWSNIGAYCLTLCDTDDRTGKTFQITRRAIDRFPPKLLPSLGKGLTTEVKFPGFDSGFYTGTAGAKRTGAGLTLRRVHGSEFYHWKDPKGTLSALTPAVEKPNTTVVLESTASAFGSVGHQFWQSARLGSGHKDWNGYQALFFPWWECDPELYRTPLMEPDELHPLDEEERMLMERHGLDLEQIKWRRRKIAEKGRADFLQEYAEDEESCWLAVGGLVYDAMVLKALKLRQPRPILSLPTIYGVVNIYAEFREGMRVIIGSDVAEGANGDRTTWVARTIDGKLLATFEDSRVDPVAFAGFLAEWGRRFGVALLVVEKNAHGITVLRELRDKHKYPSHRIYHRREMGKATQQRKELIGWHTSEETKPLVIDAARMLFTAATEGRADVPAESCIRDGFGVTRDTETGRVILNGKDMLVAEALSWLGRDSFVDVPDLAPLHY